MQRDYYRDMEIPVGATSQAIRAKYKELARKYHPDRNPNNPHAAERFKRVGVAYATLSDPVKRSAYDAERTFYYQRLREERERTVRQQQRSQSMSNNEHPFASLFNSPLWGGIKNVAGHVAQDVINNLEQEIFEEPEVDPFVKKISMITSRRSGNGSFHVSVSFQKEDVDKITHMASQGMSMEDFATDVSILVSAKLHEELMKIWKFG